MGIWHKRWVLEWNDREARISNYDKANGLIATPYRTGWTL